MKNVGVIGLGDMGTGLATNLVKAGFPTKGFDIRMQQKTLMNDLGGTFVSSIKEIGEDCDTVFIMVMTGKQVQSVIMGEGGLLESMNPGSTIVVTATINPSELKECVEPIKAKSINLIDSPVSGGKSGADNGTLTMIVSTLDEVWEANQDVLKAVGKDLFHVGTEPGQGQIIKASLQALIGSSFIAIFEALVLGTKAGADPRILYNVFCSSGVGSNLLKNCGELILQRKFEKTGSHIATMYKDMGISLNLAKESGCAMYTAATAYEMFQTGKSLFPEGDNWAIVKFLEKIAGTEVKG